MGPSNELNFEGRVAIVTGAGAAAGLGRAFALLLAKRGARVVVNDLGTGPDGRGIERVHADLVVAEIKDQGGDAVADGHSVAGEQSATAVVQTALDNYGSVDILINAAGVYTPGEFLTIASDDLEKMLAVHLMGNIWMCRAVWSHMYEQNYGRIVNVTSISMWGSRMSVGYGCAKAGILGLTRGLALEGASNNICVNALAPRATTSAVEYFQTARALKDRRPPEAVAAVVGYLCHEQCHLNGDYVATSNGHVALGMFGTTLGYDCGVSLTPEDVQSNLRAIRDTRVFDDFGYDPVATIRELKAPQREP